MDPRRIPSIIPMGEFTEMTTIEAPRDVVWGLISIQENWSRWAPAREVVLDPPGSPEPNGVGAVRHMRAVGRIGAREEIIAYDPPSYLAYRLLVSFPVRNYTAHMRLAEAGKATALEWSAEWDDPLGFAEGAVTRVMRRIVQKMAAAIKADAEQDAATNG